MDIAERSKALYGPYVSGENLRKVLEMDEPDQVYFWTKLYYELNRSLKRSWLEDMEHAAARRVGVHDEPSPTPFRDAEDSISAGSWFRGPHVL